MRVLVVDDHTLVRVALCRLLDTEADIEVVGQTGSGREAVELVRSLAPDVVLLDYGLPDLDGFETTQQIVALNKAVRILILTMYDSEEYATRLIREGAAGYVVKAASTDELLTAVRKVAANGVYVSPHVLERMVGHMGRSDGPAPESRLSNREMQVLLRLARGATTREISEELSLSISTVETYRSRILGKLELRNNSDLTRFAVRRNLVDCE